MHAHRREVVFARQMEGQFAVGNQSQLPPIDPMNRPDDVKLSQLFAH